MAIKDNKIVFPLDLEELQAITASAIIGVVTLVNGSAIVQNPRITKQYFPIIQRLTAVNPGFLYVTLGSGQMTISSTSSTDGSKVFYLLLPSPFIIS